MEPYTGEIRMFAGPRAPLGWALCDGSPRNTTEDKLLFDVIQYTYGGSGPTFYLPDLSCRVPVGVGNADHLNIALGESIGTQTHALTTAQTPAHVHGASLSDVSVSLSIYAADADADLYNPQGNVYAPNQTMKPYSNIENLFTSDSIPLPVSFEGNATVPENTAPAKTGTPHANEQPYLCINYIICLAGNYPNA